MYLARDLCKLIDKQPVFDDANPKNEANNHCRYLLFNVFFLTTSKKRYTQMLSQKETTDGTKTMRYKLSPTSDVGVEKSCFFNIELKMPYQQLFYLVS